MSRTPVFRFGYGLLLLAEPEQLLRLGDVDRQPRWAGPVLRLLGARHLAQAAALSARPELAPLGAVVDFLHALTELGCAALVPSLRRPALVDAILAVQLAMAGVLQGR